MRLRKKTVIMDAQGLSWTIKRMAHEIIEKNKGIKDLIVIGIQTRGVWLGRRLVREMKKITKKDVPMGILDITLYRDDVDSIAHQPMVKETRLPFDITGRKVLLIDDVLYTGRTIRAAMDELIDFGRPRLIRLAVLIDRGLRELPIQADFIGKVFLTTRKQAISVELRETDGRDQVLLKEIK